MTAVMNRNLLFSLPDVLMTQVFGFDDTYRIFGSSKFKKDLFDEWLKMQSNHVKKRVTAVMRDYIDVDANFMYKNEYCCVGGPSDQFFKYSVYGYNTRVHIEATDEFMVYVAEPRFDILYYKILPKEFINKPKEFFEKIRLFDGFFCETDNVSLNYVKIFRYLYNKHCAPVECDWYTTRDGHDRAPIMYRQLDCWF